MMFCSDPVTRMFLPLCIDDRPQREGGEGGGCAWHGGLILEVPLSAFLILQTSKTYVEPKRSKLNTRMRKESRPEQRFLAETPAQG